MNKTLSRTLLALLLSSVCSAHAGLYKGLDEEGNVVYSDKPFDEAKEFTPPNLSIIDATEVKPKPEPVIDEEKAADTRYSYFAINSPTNNQTIWNEPQLLISLQIKPALNLTQGHSTWLIMDGKPKIRNSKSLSLSVGRADRGSHTLQAQIRDKKGKIIKRTRTITVHVKNSVIRKAPAN